MDILLDDIKKFLFPNKIEYKPCDEQTHINLKANPITTVSANKNKLVTVSYYFFRNILINLLVHKKIFKLKKEGFKLVIIEGVNVNRLLVPINYRVMVTCDHQNRLTRKSKREKEKLTMSDLLAYDSIHQLINCDNKFEYDYTFDNSGPISNMSLAAQEIYEDYHQKTNKKQ